MGPLAGRLPLPHVAPRKENGSLVARAAQHQVGTQTFFRTSAGCSGASPAFPICYLMARGATLAEMYEISRGKNMHADPPLVSPIMEV